MSHETEIERLKVSLDAANALTDRLDAQILGLMDERDTLRFLSAVAEAAARSIAQQAKEDIARRATRCDQAEAKERDTAAVANAAMAVDLATIHAGIRSLSITLPPASLPAKPSQMGA